MHSGGMEHGRRVGGKWIIERQLGAGGMGAIFIAQHAQMGRRAALKCVLSEHVDRAGARERFEREAKIMARVSSPHVVQILDYGTDEATKDLFLVMELLEGEDLSKLLARLGPLPPLLVARLLAQSVKGLIAAHDLGVVHRDIKPQNLFLARFPDGSRILKVLDFGIGRILETPGGAPQQKLTGTHGTIGSPPYMSPEQLRGSSGLDQRTDLWSLGATGYELLAGKLPFSEATDFAELVRQIVFGNPEPLAPRAPWAPAELLSIIGRCMQRDLAQRYPDARAVAADLAFLLSGADQITEAMLVPLSDAERVSVAVPAHGLAAPAAQPMTNAPDATGFGAPPASAHAHAAPVAPPMTNAPSSAFGPAPATAARGTAIMPASAMPFATSAPAATAVPAPATTFAPPPVAASAPVITGAPVMAIPSPPSTGHRSGVLLWAAIAIGIIALGASGFALLSRSTNDPSSGAGSASAPAPLVPADAGIDAPAQTTSAAPVVSSAPPADDPNKPPVASGKTSKPTVHASSPSRPPSAPTATVKPAPTKEQTID